MIEILKKTACAVVKAGITSVVCSALGSTIYVVFNKPSVVTIPSYRTLFRANGKFFTGHSSNAIFHNIHIS